MRNFWSVVALTLAVGLMVATDDGGPVSDADAFAWARVNRPASATGVKYYGDKGIDHRVRLGFFLPAMSQAEAFAKSFQCELKPIQSKSDNPYPRASSSAPPWWRSGPAPADSSACRRENPGTFYRSMRVEPDVGKMVWVQVHANSM